MSYLFNPTIYVLLAIGAVGLALCVYALCRNAYIERGFSAAMANLVVFGLPVAGLTTAAFISLLSE